jgi:nucleoporin NDC1
VVLSVASLEEDTYGHVQHVLPATLEAIVRFRSSIVALESELLAQAGSLGKPSQVAGDQVKEILSSYIGSKPI